MSAVNPVLNDRSVSRSTQVSNKNPLLKYAAIFLIVAVVLVGAVAGLNYWLDPLDYNKSAQIEAAEIWASGRNLRMLDSNVDWRELRREHIMRLKETPEIVVFGGSRWQEATGEIAPGKRVYNAFVTNDHFEDMLGISELLYEAKRLPKTLILSVRFTTFEFLPGREAWWWKSFRPEYLKMSERLGTPTYSRWELMQPEKFYHLLSLDMLAEHVKGYSETGVRYQATDALHDPVLGIVGADGAFRWPDKTLKKQMTLSEKEALQRAAFDRDTSPKINEALLDPLEKLIVFLQNNGVRVVFLQTPFHPAYYQAVAGSSYMAAITRIEEETKRIAAKHGVFVGGGFDARQQGCEVGDFRDFNHSSINCLKKLVAQIPNL